MSSLIEPVSNKVDRQIPLIDFRGVENSARRASIIKQLSYAFENFGFFEAINTSVTVKNLDETFDMSRAFFTQPIEKKREVYLDLNEKPKVGIFQMGWKPQFTAGTVTCHMEDYIFQHFHTSPDMPRTSDKALEGVSNGDNINVASHDYLLQTPSSENTTTLTVPNKNVYPTSMPQFREKITRMHEVLGTFMDLLLDLISESLGLEPTFIRKLYYDNSVSRIFSFHYYPKKTDHELDETDTQIGLKVHTDSSVVTIVGQGFDATGLQINVTGKEWITAVPRKGGLIINAGDILQAWSNGRYKSIVHRVINNPTKERFSFAYFLYPCEGPNGKKMIEPIPALVTRENPRRYKPFDFNDFLHKQVR